MKKLTCSKRFSPIFFCFLTTGFFLSLCHSQIGCTVEAQQLPKAKNIIFMVPDGMGLSNVTATRIFKNGPGGDPLNLETLPQIGYQRTHSVDSVTTDSAAAASAWASGEKYRNGEISCHDGNQDGKCEPAPVPTILELAKEKGKATGLVATSSITHATPAAFGAHVHTRDCEKEIARQYVQVSTVDVLLGGGMETFRSVESHADKCGTFGDFVTDAEKKGYVVVRSKKEMQIAASAGTTKILGLFASNGKTPELFRVYPEKHYPADEPTLPQMTAAALEVVQKDLDGFFLLVEGSQIDWANHRNELPYQICETLAFDDAVKIVLHWINEDPYRMTQTLVIVAADHETGGFAIAGHEGKLYESNVLAEGLWATKKHTAGDVIIWSQGPGSQYLGKALDNTDIYRVMKSVLR